MKTPTLLALVSNRVAVLGGGLMSSRRRRLLGPCAALALAALLTGNAQALLLSNQTLNVTLLPNSSYEVKLDLSTSAVSALLNTLDDLQIDALQVVDANGTVLGSIPAADLVEILDDATGGLVGDITDGVVEDLTHTITVVLNTVDQVVDPILQTVDTPLLHVSNVTVTQVPPTTSAGGKADNAPSIKITKRQLAKSKLKIKGTASDDRQVTRVEVTTNGRLRKATGTANWKASAKLHTGRNRIVVRAFDDAQHVSAPRRVTVVVK